MYIVEDSDNYGLNNDASAKYSKRFKVFGQGTVSVKPDTTKYYYEALRLSVEDAQNKAIVMASDLKVNLNIIPIQVNEQDRGISTPLVMTLKYASETTPIEAGVNKIIANIEAIFVYK